MKKKFEYKGPNMRKLISWRSLPLVVLVILAFILWRGLNSDPKLLPSALIDKPLPAFELPDLFSTDKILSRSDFIGKIALVNVWASWCDNCRREHPVLHEITNNSNIPIYGLNYKDQQSLARQQLQTFGNPYIAVAVDEKGTTAIQWGVYGTPETYLLDQQGIIRYRHVGPLTMDIWQQRLLPLVNQLKTEKT